LDDTEIHIKHLSHKSLKHHAQETGVSKERTKFLALQLYRTRDVHRQRPHNILAAISGVFTQFMIVN
jgi:flagellar biosynthesis protein FlhB